MGGINGRLSLDVKSRILTELGKPSYWLERLKSSACLTRFQIENAD